MFAADQQFANLGDFRLTTSEVIHKCRIGYRTYGTLNAAKSNAILFPTWFGGNTAQLAGYAGPDQLIDTSKYFLITVDALGNGVSSSPSNGQKPFPKFNIRDMVNSQHQLLTKHLGISHLHAVIGISMGGMQTFEWITAYPDFMTKAAPVIGSPRLASPDLLLWNAQLSAIELGQKYHADPHETMRAVLAIHSFALETPEYRAGKTSHDEFAAYRKSFEADAGVRVSAEDWASQLRAMISADAGEPETVKAKLLVVVAAQDHMVNPLPAIAFAHKIKAGLLRLDSNCGHLAPGCETATFNARVRAFLEK